MTGPSDRHLLLVAGVGGHTPQDALKSLVRVAKSVSVLFIDAWVPADRVRAAWSDTGCHGEFLVAGSFDEAIEAAAGLHERFPVDAVVTYSELLLLVHAQIAELLGLPASPVSAIKVAQSKAEQRKAFERFGVASPRFATMIDETDIDAAIAKVGLPAVFKPSLGAGSVGVWEVKSRADVVSCFAELKASPPVFIQDDPYVMLEQIIPVAGDEDSLYADYVSVESLLADGRIEHVVVTDRPRLQHGFVEEGMIMPSHLSDDDQEVIKTEAERAIRAIGLTHGATHTEVGWRNGEVSVIEVNGRAGGPIPSMLEACADYDYAAEIARAYLGLPCEEKPAFHSVAWHRYKPIPDGEWRVGAQTPAEDVLARFPELDFLSPRFQPGSEVSRKMTLHLATFMLTASSHEEARQRVEAVERALAIELEPLGRTGVGS